MSDIAIRVENLSKRYRIGLQEEQHDTLFGALASWARSPIDNYRRLMKLSSFDEDEADDVIWALRDVSFEVKRGEVVGIIGRNGAGKSTLLKILSRITEPTSGSVDLYGRVSSLLEVGTGFHPELTGRENIYLNGTILGMSKAEVDRKFDEIVDFSGVEKFIDTPVKRYSSGMKVRLAFAVAAHLEPEILLIDEMLAVGDLAFQKKCLGKMENVASTGRTVIFVSHNMAMVSSLCPRSLLIEDSKVVTDGNTEDVITRYHVTAAGETSVPLRDRRERTGSGELRFTEVRIGGAQDAAVMAGGPARFELSWKSSDCRAVENVAFVIRLRNYMGAAVLTLHTRLVGTEIKYVPSTGSIACCVPYLPLAPGIYRVDIRSVIGGKDGSPGVHAADHVDDAIQLEVMDGNFFGTGEYLEPQKHGNLLVDHRWEKMFETAHNSTTLPSVG